MFGDFGHPQYAEYYDQVYSDPRPHHEAKWSHELLGGVLIPSLPLQCDDRGVIFRGLLTCQQCLVHPILKTSGESLCIMSSFVELNMFAKGYVVLDARQELLPLLL